MPIKLNGQKYYRTAEACATAGISRNTFLRWVRMGTFADVETRDRKGWRLFTEDDLNKLRAEVNRIQDNGQT
jgi:predicted site-specific integrase-resolvase